ncbi:MAG: recombination protein RecR [Candidatus Latescibacteria bacterium]|nr:recombination protein RecR [Candidatus Latescibacterota bacterium]
MISQSVDHLIAELTKLPGIGRRSAQRIAFHLLRSPTDHVEALARLLVEVKARVRSCSLCFFLTEADPCDICADARRDRSVLLVVEQISDVLAFERTQAHRGLYHVLGGALSPLDGVGPDRLKIHELLDRLKTGEVKEVVFATNPRVEGEATAQYLDRLIRPLGIRTTRIARGVPVGSDLELADGLTLARSLEGRREL